MNHFNLFMRPLTLAILSGLALGGSGAAHAGDDDTPLYLSVAHSITRDSNFSRNDDKQGETINSTALQVGIDKAYGRQTYRGSARVSKIKYAHYGDLLNNDGKNVNGSFSSEFLRDWQVSLSGTYNENLNQIQENNNAANRVVRNIRTYREGGASLRYGIGGLYSLETNYEANKLSYSAATYQFNNANQHTTGLRGVYHSTDLLDFGLGYRLVRTHFPVNHNDENQTDRNFDLSANWRVTGLSALNAVLTRRVSTYSNDPDRKNRGWTGSINWSYTPAGLTSYGVYLARQTGTDRTKTDGGTSPVSSLATSNTNVTTTLGLSARMPLTGKTALTANHTVSRFAVDNMAQGSIGSIPADYQFSSNSIAHASVLGLNYAASRSINLGCSYQMYSQTAGAYRIGYEGHSVDCTASLTVY